MNKTKLFLFIFFIVLVISSIILHFYLNSLYDKDYEKICYDCFDENIREIYKNNKDLFEFDENDTAILGIETVLNSSTISLGDLEHDKYGNFCVGYFIITKNENDIDIDSSHMCDLIQKK